MGAIVDLLAHRPRASVTFLEHDGVARRVAQDVDTVGWAVVRRRVLAWTTE